MLRITRSTLSVMLAATTAAFLPASPASAFPLSVTWLGSGTVTCPITGPCTVTASSTTCVEADTSALFTCSVTLSGTVTGVARSAAAGVCLGLGIGDGWISITDGAGSTASIPVVLVETGSGITNSVEIVSSPVTGVLATQCQLHTPYAFTGTYHL